MAPQLGSLAWATLIMEMSGEEWRGMNLKERQIVFAQLAGFIREGLTKRERDVHVCAFVDRVQFQGLGSLSHFHYHTSQTARTKQQDV